MDKEVTFEHISQLAERTEAYWRPLYYHVVPEIINDNNFKVGVEIGVAFGGHAEAILQNTQIVKLICIDPWEFTGAEFEGLKTKRDYDDWFVFVCKRLDKYNNGVIDIIKRRVNVARGKSDDCIEVIHNKHADFVFIDGDHSYEQVTNDIQNYLPKIRKGGMLIGHDYDHRDFEGVKRAVDEFVKSSGLELKIHDGYVWSIQL